MLAIEDLKIIVLLVLIELRKGNGGDKRTPDQNIVMLTRAEDLGKRHIFHLNFFKNTVILDETGRTLQRQDQLLHL